MSNYIPDPVLEAEWAIQAFVAALAAEDAAAALVDQLRSQLDTQFARYEREYQPWLLDDAARYALRQGVAVLTAYRLYQQTIAAPELLRMLRRCFVEPLRETVCSSTARMLDEAQDPFAEIVNVAKLREQRVFGRSFQFEKPRDDDKACYLDVVRCLWHSFFVSEGCPELTQIFCAFDDNWISAIDPDRHGVRFERALTLGTGGSLCPFHFFRVQGAVEN
jgi:L-2-amino-thiazoline-4-carboxylic acid hydrolase